METLIIPLHSTDDKVKFNVTARDTQPVVTDVIPPTGTGESYTLNRSSHRHGTPDSCWHPGS